MRVEAIGVNFGDVLFRRGDYFLDATFPAVPGYETAGRVVAVGDGVESDMIGPKVLVIPSGAPPCPHRRVTRAAGLAPSAAATTC